MAHHHATRVGKRAKRRGAQKLRAVVVSTGSYQPGGFTLDAVVREGRAFCNERPRTLTVWCWPDA